MPRNVTITLSNGKTHTYNNVPDNVTPEQIEQRAAQEFRGLRVTDISGGKKAAAPKTPSRAEAFSAGMDQAKLNVFNAMMTGARKIGLVGPETPEQRQQRANFQRDYGAPMAEVGRARPRARLAGEIFGEAVLTEPLTLGIGGLFAKGGGRLVKETGRIAKVSPKVAKVTKRVGRVAQATGKAVQQGGIGVKAVSKEAVKRGAPVAATRLGRVTTRVAGGATAGAIAGGATDKDVLDSAMLGGGIPVVASIARRGVGWTWDLIAGRLGETKAAEIFRNLIADKASGITEALASAPKNIQANTAEFLASKGLLTPELAAATNITARSPQYGALLDVAQQRAATEKGLMSTLRGGETLTEATENINAMRKGVQETAEPYRQAAMTEADVGRNIILPAEEASRAFVRGADELTAAGQVRRMRGLEGRTQEQMADVFTHPELYSPSTSGRALPRLGEIADQAGQRADEGIDLQLFMRDQARIAQGIADDLRAQGYAPLDITPVVRNLRQLANDAYAVSPDREKIFTAFANALEARAARNGGVIDAAGLHLAKRNIGEFVSSVLGQADPAALKRGTALLAGESKKLIDDAFNTASAGTPWETYNRVFNQGMRRVEEQVFAKELTKLTPQRFEKVMRGDDPDFVASVFPGEFDITKVLSPTQRAAANELYRSAGAGLDVAATGLRDLPQYERGALATGVKNKVQDIMYPGMSLPGRLLYRAPAAIPGASAAVNLANIEQSIANRMSRGTMRSLAPALAQPSVANRMLGIQPTAARIEDVVNVINPNVLAQLMRGYVGSGPYAQAPAVPYDVDYSE